MSELDPQPVSLSVLPQGGCGIIVSVSDREELMRLKSMGICLGRRVEIIKQGNPLIVRVFGSRIGLSRRLAEDVSVVECGSAPRCWEAEHLIHGAAE
jgi:Fe2+ transport system protein FeoA